MLTEKEFIIDGMSCQHCVAAVRDEIEKLQGARVENVAIGRARIAFEESYVSEERLREAVREAGYEVREVR